MERGAGGPAQRTARSRAVGGSHATAPPSAEVDPDGPRVPPPSPGTTDAPTTGAAGTTARSSVRRWGENRERPEGNCHKGYHPVTGLLVRSCCCPFPAECREVMWHYAANDDGDACQYLFLPGHPKKEDTMNGRHVIQFRDNVFRHLFGSGAHSAKEKWKGKKCYVAFHHFPPPIRRLLPSFRRGSAKKINLFRIPESVARECGLTDADRCKTSGTRSSDKTYFPSPTVPMRESLSFVGAAAEGGRSVVTSASHASSDAPSSASRASQNTEGGFDSSIPPSHETPRERQRERIARGVAENPMAAAKLIQEQHDEIKALKEQLILSTRMLTERIRWS